MDLQTALDVFGVLERVRFDDPAEPESEWHPPIYDVRLDATTDRHNDERGFRIRVVGGGSMGGLDAAQWAYVLEIAGEYEDGLLVDIENSALVLR